MAFLAAKAVRMEVLLRICVTHLPPSQHFWTEVRSLMVDSYLYCGLEEIAMAALHVTRVGKSN